MHRNREYGKFIAEPSHTEQLKPKALSEKKEEKKNPLYIA